jgi:hypothetical protein
MTIEWQIADLLLNVQKNLLEQGPFSFRFSLKILKTKPVWDD